MDRISLRAENLCLEVAPNAGGIVTAFWTEARTGRIDWFKAASGTDALSAACFPLVPYSNRIRNGRFHFADREIALPLNFADHPHSIHGHGWQAPWQIADQGADRLDLVNRHAADAWPFEYEARQSFRLSVGALEIEVSVRNLSIEKMPAGLGLHPYFPLRANATLGADVDAVWLTDDEVMPTKRVRPPPSWDLATGVEVRDMAIDNGFDSWSGRASIAWPDEGASLEIAADTALRKLVVYAPPGGDFFCVEPVSHMTDAFNRAADGAPNTSMRALAPGETLSARVSFKPIIHPA